MLVILTETFLVFDFPYKWFSKAYSIERIEGQAAVAENFMKK